MTIQISIDRETITIYEINKIAHILRHIKGSKVSMDKAIRVVLQKPFRPTQAMHTKLSLHAIRLFNNPESKIFFIGFDESEFFGNIIRRFRLELEGEEPVYFQYY